MTRTARDKAAERQMSHIGKGAYIHKAVNTSNERLSVDLRRAQRPDIQGLLRTQNEPGETTQPSAYRPSKTALRRSFRHVLSLI